MNLKLIAYGIAKDILQGSQLEIEMRGKPNIHDIKKELIKQYPPFAELKSLRFAVNEDYQNDEYQVSEDDEIVIIPPVSGG